MDASGFASRHEPRPRTGHGPEDSSSNALQLPPALIRGERCTKVVLEEKRPAPHRVGGEFLTWPKTSDLDLTSLGVPHYADRRTVWKNKDN